LRSKARLGIGLLAAASHLSVVALAAPSVMVAGGVHPTRAICNPGEVCVMQPAADNAAAVTVPAGAGQCPDSGAGSSCPTATPTAPAGTGAAATPDGQPVCALVDGTPVPVTPATCSNAVLDPVDDRNTGASNPVVLPSVPIASLAARGPRRIVLAASSAALRTGGKALLTATADSTVTGTGLALEIFDASSHQVIAACAQGSQCAVAYSASAGSHDLVAFAMAPSDQVPQAAASVSSNHVTVGWLDSGITASRTVVGPGQPVTLTATSTFDVHASGRWLEIYDLTTSTRLTYCSRGTVCSTSMKQASGGTHEIVGYVNGQPEAVSAPIYVTWLAVSLSATSIGPSTGGTVYLRAVTNADLTSTPWVVGILDDKGRLVDHACKAGTSCSVQAWMSGGTTPSYTAVIGAVPATSKQDSSSHSAASPTTASALVDVQARSSSVEPTHLLWGVDSCKAMTGDPSGDEVFPTIVGGMGTPDFWGRYLTDTVCPGITSAEVALAAKYHIGILPIYNDYDCSNVVYYQTGHDYAAAAVDAAKRLGIPKGRVLAIDIEPYGAACPGAGSVDSGFIEGWFDGISGAGYVPVYYGNGTDGSEFANAWCAAVSALPSIAQGSDLWSFEPSLIGDFSKTVAPQYGPYSTGCPSNIEAWQYLLGSNGPDGDVDQDEALSSLALWYPS
jgi:Domain of unknown function (DUF1906)